jgi:CHAT domain-containing protein
VTASLWKVPDEATRLLMERFYANLWSDKKMSKVEALRQAQLWMLREGRKNLEGKLRDRGTTLAEEMRGRGLDFEAPQP